jgi:hypothetical protein
MNEYFVFRGDYFLGKIEHDQKLLIGECLMRNGAIYRIISVGPGPGRSHQLQVAKAPDVVWVAEIRSQ